MRSPQAPFRPPSIQLPAVFVKLAARFGMVPERLAERVLRAFGELQPAALGLSRNGVQWPEEGIREGELRTLQAMADRAEDAEILTALGLVYDWVEAGTSRPFTGPVVLPPPARSGPPAPGTTPLSSSGRGIP